MLKFFSTSKKQDKERFQTRQKINSQKQSKAVRVFGRAQRLEHINNQGPQGRGRKP